MTAAQTFTWDGLDASEVAARLGIANLWMYTEVESTQDIAHGLAEKGVSAGAVVIADTQRSGRGRQGKSWASQAGQGVWCTIVERPADTASFEVLSLRVGTRLAAALDAFAGQRVQLKWPNDLVVPGASGVPIAPGVIPSAARDPHFAKLAGILTEARWSGSSLSWVAVGIGVNVSHPGVDGAAALLPGTTRIDVLRAVVDSVRSAAASTGQLSSGEIDQFHERDALAGKRIVGPGVGVVQGIDASGALLVLGDAGVTAYRSGTLQLENGS